jgi:hypothetical protein
VSALKIRVLTLGLVLALAAAVAWVLILRPNWSVRAASAPASASPVISAPTVSAAATNSCQASISACDFPDAASTGVPATVTLKSVPSQVSSGPGWVYIPGRGVYVTGNGAVLSGLSIVGPVNITASNVTLSDDRIVTGGIFGVELRDTANDTIENSTISGLNATTGRVDYAIDDIYSNSTGLVIKDNDIAYWRIGINVSSGLITGNYIHSPGYIRGDHTDGIYDTGGTGQLTITGNTVLDSLSQTCAIMLESFRGRETANKTISGNLLAGGGFVIYAAGGSGDSRNIVIQDNRFSQLYYQDSGQFGPITQFQAGGSGNDWSGNIWSGDALPGNVLQGNISNGPEEQLISLP